MRIQYIFKKKNNQYYIFNVIVVIILNKININLHYFKKRKVIIIYII